MKRFVKTHFILVAALLFASPATAQSVRQFNTVTPGHVAVWSANGVLRDGGSAASGAISTLGTTASGPSICATSDLTSAAAYQRICFGATTADGGQISVQNFGTAIAKPLSFNINGTVIEVPAISGVTVGSTPVAGGANGQILYDNSGVLGEIGTVGSGSVVLASATSTTINGTVCSLGGTCTVATSATSVTVGVTTVGGGTTGRILYDNAGTLDELSVTGTGGVVLQVSPSLTTPTLGVATATSISFGGSTLSNYVEGTWIPTLIGSTSGSWTLAGASTAGFYERIGRQVNVRFSLLASSASSPLGNIQIGGLPLTSAATTNNNGACTISYYGDLTNSASYTIFAGVVLASSAVISIFESGSGQTSQAAAVARSGSTPLLIGSCVYQV